MIVYYYIQANVHILILNSHSLQIKIKTKYSQIQINYVVKCKTKQKILFSLNNKKKYYCRSNENSYDFLYLLLTFLLYPFFNNQQNM